LDRGEIESLLAEDAKTAAFRCLDIFKEFDITDIDVIICEEVLLGECRCPRLRKWP